MRIKARYVLELRGSMSATPGKTSGVVFDSSFGDLTGTFFPDKFNIGRVTPVNQTVWCTMTKSKITASECNDFDKSIYSVNTQKPISADTNYNSSGSSCSMTIPNKCSDLYITDPLESLVSGKPVKHQINSSSGSYKGAREKTIHWSETLGRTVEEAEANSKILNNDLGISFKCKDKNIPYSYDGFHVELTSSCSDPSRSFLVFTPHETTTGSNTIGDNRNDNCNAHGFHIDDVEKQVGDTYLNVRCDGDTLVTSVTNTIIPCVDCLNS